MGKVTIHDSTFTPFSYSASLREDNIGVKPKYIEWTSEPGHGIDVYTDGHIKEVDTSPAIAWLIEPRGLHPENYETAYELRDKFDAILTYDEDLLNATSKAKFYPFGGSSIALEDWGIYPKTKDVCMILSDKQSMPGHKLRHEIAARFGDRIDCYGVGVGKPFSRKFDVLKDYRYCVVVESEQNNFYFTEKLIDCLAVGTTPIYWGCPSIYTYYDIWMHCQFKSIDRLNRLLEIIAPFPLYYTVHNMEAAHKYRVCEDTPQFLRVIYP